MVEQSMKSRGPGEVGDGRAVERIESKTAETCFGSGRTVRTVSCSDFCEMEPSGNAIGRAEREYGSEDWLCV